MNAKLKVKLLPALIGAALALSSIYSQAYDYKPERKVIASRTDPV